MYKKFISKNFGQVHLKGFEYLAECCELYSPEMKMSNLTGLIAKKHHDSTSAVEKALRWYIKHAIQDSAGQDNLKCPIINYKPKEVIAAIVFTVNEERD